MAAPSIARRLRAGETLYCAWASMPEPMVAEAMARAGYDCVNLEIQHGFQDVNSVMRGIAAVALAGKAPVVRIAVGDNATASRALDMGAECIIAPMINSAADAEALVAATRYPPVGERSWGPVRAMQLQGTPDQQTQLETGNANTFIFAMIETTRALDALDDILAVEGIDGVFVGPSDLSVTLTGGKRIAPFDAILDAPATHVAKRAAELGKIAGAFCANAERGRHFRKLGYRFIALATDQIFLMNGASDMLRAASGD